MKAEAKERRPSEPSSSSEYTLYFRVYAMLLATSDSCTCSDFCRAGLAAPADKQLIHCMQDENRLDRHLIGLGIL